MDFNQILKSMSLEEKASLCSGKDFWNLKSIERLNIPSIMVSDGPHGLRKQKNESDQLGLNTSVRATCFPTAVTTASSWDKELMYEMGIAIAKEALQEGVSVVLGPGINIKRTPLCGRNFEYISEDPFITGELASAFINGVQSKGIGTSLKHYAVNSQEKHRMTISSVVDERTLREIYLAGFETAVKKSQPWTVMSSYNKVNGTYSSENKKLLHDILREEWGFLGLVVTDWGACNDRVEGLIAGQDLEMPASLGINDKKIVEAVKNGRLKEEQLDQAVIRILNLIYLAEKNKKENFQYNRDEHHHLARKIAESSMVLLKNEDNILPISQNTKCAIIGEFAKTPRYQGAGSSNINPTKLDNVYDELRRRGIEFTYAQGYDLKEDQPNHHLIEEACEIAKNTEIVIIFAGLTDVYESEGFDRQHLNMPESHNQLIEAISEVNSNIIVILSGGSPVEMPWLGRVKGLLNSYLGGQAGALAVVDLLYGDVNPSGKLAETYPIKLEDTPSYPYYNKGRLTSEHREGIYVGYRYYDTADIDVLFPFGYGLSYTQFEYSNIQISKNQIHDGEIITVSVTIKNTGKRAGAEVVQLYIHDQESTIFRPLKELKGFEKVYLEVNEEQTINFSLDKRSFAYYHVKINDWHVESGEFDILIGASSQDIRLQATIDVKSTQSKVEVPNYRLTAPNYYTLKKDGLQISDQEFEMLYGSKLPATDYLKGQSFTMNSTLLDMNTTFFGKIINKLVRKFAKKVSHVGEDDLHYKMFEATINEAPLRTLVMMSNGAFHFKTAQGILDLVNGCYLRGILKILFHSKK